MAIIASNPVVLTADAVRLSGLSRSMIEYLGREDILRPSGSGKPRRGKRRLYTLTDVIFLRVIADLLSYGIEVKRLKAALHRAKAEAQSWMDIRTAPRRFLVTDGTEVFIRAEGQLESKTFDRQLAFAFVMDLAAVHRTVVAGWPLDVPKQIRTSR